MATTAGMIPYSTPAIVGALPNASDIDPAQRDQDDERGNDEQHASDNAATRAMHGPANISRKLLRFRSGQQHAVVQCVQEARLVDPFAPYHQLIVHDGDLPGRSAKADEA
jgi:hypothetical protein